MSLVKDFLNYYLNQIKQEQNNFNYFMENVSQFNINLSDYVKSNLVDLELSTLESTAFQYDKDNTVIIFNYFDISPYLSIQPIVDLKSTNTIKVKNLSFNFTLKFNNTTEEFFSYLTPYEYDEDFTTFTELIHILYFMYDSNILTNFYQAIHVCHQELYSKVSSHSPVKQELNPEPTPITNSSESEEELEDDMKRLDDFIKKYTKELNEVYGSEVKFAMIQDREALFLQLSNFLDNQLIGKTFKYDKLIDTLENYTPIFNAVHLDKQIFLAAHYSQNPKFTI